MAISRSPDCHVLRLSEQENRLSSCPSISNSLANYARPFWSVPRTSRSASCWSDVGMTKVKWQPQNLVHRLVPTHIPVELPCHFSTPTVKKRAHLSLNSWRLRHERAVLSIAITTTLSGETVFHPRVLNRSKTPSRILALGFLACSAKWLIRRGWQRMQIRLARQQRYAGSVAIVHAAY